LEGKIRHDNEYKSVSVVDTFAKIVKGVYKDLGIVIDPNDNSQQMIGKDKQNFKVAIQLAGMYLQHILKV